MRDTNSCPNSPARSVERWEIENDHLKQQISLLQFELDNRRRAFLLAVQEINATHETRARHDEGRIMYLKQSNQELAVQVERLTKRSHRDQAKTATAERAVYQLEAQNVWLEAQLKASLHENTKNQHQNQSQSPHTVVLFRETTSAPPQLQTEDLSRTVATTTAGMNIEGNNLSLSLTLSEDSSLAGMQPQQQQRRAEDDNTANGSSDNLSVSDINDDTINNQFSFPIMSSLPLSPPPSMPPPPRRSTYAEAITGTMNNNLGNMNNTSITAAKRAILITNTTANTTTNIATATTRRKRATYGTNPRFLEIRQAYHSVLTSQAEEEEPLARWVRTVMSNTSAIETDPKKVEPVLLGLKELCEENGIPLPLHRVGPCQFQLVGKKSGGQRLSVRLINGRLMARSGPAWLDIFKWLERQPLAIEEGDEDVVV
ncbi:hypothetical protein Ndes2526B_g08401 [Nannochloris sp. 'desiccata']